MSRLVYFVEDIVSYQESTTLQLFRTAAAVGNTIYVRSQMTDSRQHAESTTLQLCRTAAAAVDSTMYVKPQRRRNHSGRRNRSSRLASTAVGLSIGKGSIVPLVCSAAFAGLRT